MHDPESLRAQRHTTVQYDRAKEPCADYRPGPGYGEYTNGNPCANCRWPEVRHKSDEERADGTVHIKSAVAVTGLWLRRIGDSVQMLAEVKGGWKLVAEERADSPFSHIVEPAGIQRSPPDSLTPRTT